MDEALRAQVRDEDTGWLGRALALRRAGEEFEALRVAQSAARAEREGAREFLASEFPLSPEALAVLEHLRPDPDLSARDALRAQEWAASVLLGLGDPRADRALEEWLARVQSVSGPEPTALDSDGRYPWPGGALATEGVVARLLAGGGQDLPWRLVELSSGEGTELAQALLAAQEPPSAHLLLRALHLLIRSGGERHLAGPLVARAASPRERAALERALAAERGEALAASGLPLRPAWVDPLQRDPLTLALNRSSLQAELGPPGGNLRLPPCSWVAYLDVDRLLYLNDVWGFQRGEALLGEISAQLQVACGDRVVRWGGDEWLVIWEGEDPGPLLEDALEALRARDDLAWEWNGEHHRASFSAGLARRRAGEEDLALLQRLDEACYAAKCRGRGCVVRAEDVD